MSPTTPFSITALTSSENKRFFPNLPQWGSDVLRTAMDNALTRRQLRLSWPVADQLDSALSRLSFTMNQFAPGPDATPATLATALTEFGNSYNALMDRLDTLPLVRPDACASLRDVLTANSRLLDDAGLSCSGDGRTCNINERRFREGLEDKRITEGLWGEDGVLAQLRETLETIRDNGPASLLDPVETVEDIPAAWKDLVDLERRGALVDFMTTTLDQMSNAPLIDEKA